MDRLLFHRLIKSIDFVGEGLILTSDATRFSDPPTHNDRMLPQHRRQFPSSLVPPLDPAGGDQPSGLDRTFQIILGIGVILINAMIYGVLICRWLDSRPN